MTSGSFEQILLSLAVRKKLVSQEAALGCLREFRAQPAGGIRPVTELLMSRGLVSAEQAAALAKGARAILASARTEKAASPAPPAAPRNPAEPVPGYKIVGKLGAGGTATIFLAEDVRNGNRQVALKILHPAKAADPKQLERFTRESKLLIAFDHPHIVKGFAAGRSGPLAWVAMEYLRGESLQDLIERDGGFSEARSLEILLETARALEYIHGKGIVHRDIKPGNLQILPDGRIKLLDLGFALPMGGTGEDSETTSGTVQYMSPEQARGATDIDVRADIYSLGASLYHMVMGEVPFTGGDSLEVMAKQVMEALNSTEIKNRRLSKHLHYFIERMMSKEKDFRYATTTALIEDINAQIEGFRSLEYRPEEKPSKTSRILDGLKSPPRNPMAGGGGITRRFRPGTGRFKK